MSKNISRKIKSPMIKHRAFVGRAINKTVSGYGCRNEGYGAGVHNPE